MENGQQFNEDDDKITRIERTTAIGDLNRGDVKKTRGGMRTLTKRTKLGTQFCFVRYVNVGDTMDFEKKLGGISINNVKILINIAKYDKGGQSFLKNEKHDVHNSDWNWTFRNIETKRQVEHSGWNETFRKQDPKQKTGHSEDERSFKDAILGTQGANKKQAEMKKRSNVIEVQANKSHLARLKCCWVGKAR
ncbi:nucleotide-binding alpha-beta plait domain-containing protein, partial [Tanacetum coccineum]